MKYSDFELYYFPIIKILKIKDSAGARYRFWNFLRPEKAEYMKRVVKLLQATQPSIEALGEILSKMRILRTVTKEQLDYIDIDAVKENLDWHSNTMKPSILRFPLVYRPCPNCYTETRLMEREGLWVCPNCGVKWVDEFFIPEKVMNPDWAQKYDENIPKEGNLDFKHHHSYEEKGEEVLW